MARKDLLSEAIADAKAVKETALANAKLALEEAFTPKLQSMISAKLAEEMDDEDMDEGHYEGMHDDETEEGAHEGMHDDETEEGYHEEMEGAHEDDDDMDEAYHEEMDDETEEGYHEEMDDDMDEAYHEEMDDDDLDEIIRELEMEGAHEDDDDMDEAYHEEMDDDDEIDLDEVINALKEMAHEDEMEEMGHGKEEGMHEDDLEDELEEAYKTIESLQATINEVNLLNAKLLYTNKLFRTFDLNESHKVKVLENFDRTSSVREVKLVYATLAENLNVAKNKKVVKEGYASKTIKSSAPKKQIITETNNLASRWKTLAGLK
jgi:hypothetical protein